MMRPWIRPRRISCLDEQLQGILRVLEGRELDVADEVLAIAPRARVAPGEDAVGPRHRSTPRERACVAVVAGHEAQTPRAAAHRPLEFSTSASLPPHGKRLPRAYTWA
jgi:hypothetical protein